MNRLTLDGTTSLHSWGLQPTPETGMLSLNNAGKITSKVIDQRFRNRVNSLGIPVDNLTFEQTLSSIFELIEQYKIDKTPKLVATLNVDFLVNSLGYRFDKPRHPELLNILRKADIVTADGFPIVMLSKLSGFTLKERVTGADLAPSIAQLAADKGKSIYLMGGMGDSAKQAAKLLQKDNPCLRIAGVSAPFVAIEGEKLSTWDKDDLRTVNHINRSGADILFIGLGNPKQELWFARNKHRLTVPVSIGIGGTFSFITGDIKRAPKWMQQLNMEWIFRMSQDPKRLVKRYATGMVKFGFLALPLALPLFLSLSAESVKTFFGKCLSCFFRPIPLLGRQKGKQGDKKQSSKLEQTLPWNIHWASKDDALKTLRLSKKVSRADLESLITDIQRDIQTKSVIYTYMIDFSKVRSLAIDANEAFCELNRLFKSNQANGLLIDLPKALKKRLANSRVMDFAEPNLATAEQMQKTITDSHNIQFKTYIVGQTCFSYFSGEITGEALVEIGFEDSLLNVADERDCIIDLRRVTNIDSAALAIMYRFSQAQKRGDIRPIRLSGINPVIRQMITIVGLDTKFICLSDDLFYDHIFSSNNSK